MFTYFWHVFENAFRIQENLLVTYLSPILRFWGLGFLAGSLIHKTYERNVQRKSWIFRINFWGIPGSLLGYNKDFQENDEIMTEDPGNNDEEWANIPEEIAELKPMALNNVPNPATCKYHQKLRNSKKVLGCLVATNLQGACWIFGHLFRGIADISGHSSRKFLRISRFYQFPRISGISHEFARNLRNLRDFGHYYTHALKGWPAEEEQQHTQKLRN